MRICKKIFNRKRQILTMSLLGVMILSFDGSAVATSYNNEYKVPVSNYQEDNLDIDPVQSLLIPRQYSTLESYYNSKDYGYITSVKNQNPYGTCWSFATMAASEASMIKEGLGQKDSLDLSEWQLAYFTAHSVTDPLGGTAGDCFALADTDYLNAGGNQQIATYRIANWYGVADETTAPYTTISQYTKLQIEKALAHTLPNSAAYSQDIAHLENAYWISMSDSTLVKQMIKQYGACGASYYSADAYYSTGEEGTWNADEEVAVYCPTAPASDSEPNTNHAITIIGWDDDYSKSNFKSGAQPENDGAWYCKNSWGSNWSKDGCFWISYEDARLKEETAFFFDYGTADNYDNNYQYDGGAWGGSIEGYNAIANIYTAKQAEYVKAVGFYTDNSNYNCKVYIYKNVDSDAPYSGSLVLEQNANQLYAGFHTVELSEPIEVEKGESYSVVVYQTPANGGNTRFTLDKGMNGAWFTNTVATKAGQSFIGIHEAYMWDAGVEYSANCRIKAYTDNKIFVSDISFDCNEKTLYTKESFILASSILPENADDKRVIWSSSDDTVATVDSEGKVTAIKAGTATITCAAQDGSGVVEQCEVTVKQRAEELTIEKSLYKLTNGEQLQLNAIVLPIDTTDKSISWHSEDETVATISDTGVVTAVGTGTTIVTCQTMDGSNIQAQCEVTVEQYVESLNIDCKSKAMMNGDTLQLNVTVLPEDAVDKSVSWSSSDDNVATVSSDGMVTAIGYGVATITCTATDRRQCNATCVVSVTEKMISISLSQTNITLNEGQTLQLQPTTTPALNKTKGVYWVSANESVVKVDGNGMLTAIAPGVDVDVKCIAKDGSGIATTCKVTVVKQKVNDNSNTTQQPVDGSNNNQQPVIDEEEQSSASNTEYKLMNNSTVQFVDGSNCTGVVEIPNTVTIDGIVYKVTSVEANAFKGNEDITKVVIGDNVATIGKNAFYNCKKLKTVTLGKNIKTIDNKAFYQCGKLSKIVIPSKVTKIGKQAFYNCKSLKNITIKTSKLTKKKVGSKAFKGIHAKAVIKVPKKKVNTYKSILKARGIGNKVKVKK